MRRNLQMCRSQNGRNQCPETSQLHLSNKSLGHPVQLVACIAASNAPSKGSICICYYHGSLCVLQGDAGRDPRLPSRIKASIRLPSTLAAAALHVLSGGKHQPTMEPSLECHARRMRFGPSKNITLTLSLD